MTSAASSRSRQVASRRRSYLLVQGLRVVLFVLAVFAPLPLLARVALLGVCGLLSFVSVTAANSPERRAAPATPPVQLGGGRPVLPAGS